MGSGGDNISVLKRGFECFASDEAGDVSHVHEKVAVHLVCNLCGACEEKCEWG